ncbi:hypothetical protein MMC27_006626 [Xylographa pallens]|nr:hypothetical protein [Xylographa pallens]
MKNSDYELTYGVEIQFVLVFHQRLVFAQLEHDAGRPTVCNNDYRVEEAQINAYLEKNLTPEERIQMNPVPPVYHRSRPQYLAWGIRVGTTEAPELIAAAYSTDWTLRTYQHEHLYIAREALRSAGQNARLQYWDAAFPSDITIDIRLAKPTTFDNWHLIKELVIEALTQTELEHYLAAHKRCFERDGPTSGQRSKRSLSPNASSAGGSAPKKQKLTQSPFNIASSSQSNDTNQENLTPTPPGRNTAQSIAGLSSSSQSNDTNQENLPPKPTGANTVQSIYLPAVTAARTTSSETQARLPETSEWDSQGAELVSRVFTLTNDETGFPEINELCNRLKGQPCHLHGATASPKTGLHVHMKHAHGDIDHETLQNLLYILVMYEKQINTLLPRHRRTDSTSDTAQNELRSNCTNVHYPDDNDPPPNQAYPTTERPLTEVRTRIFEQEGSVLHGLIFLSGGEKKRAVNFTNLLDDPDKPIRPHTIEFRQHESVLRGEMIQYWVRFCAGLLRLANHRAHIQTPQTSGARPDAVTRDSTYLRQFTAVEIAQRTGTTSPLMRTNRLPSLDAWGSSFAEWDDSMSVFDLIEEMELDDETTQYFHRRAAFFAAQDPEVLAGTPPPTHNTEPSMQNPDRPIVTPPTTRNKNPRTQGGPGAARRPPSVASSEASTTIASPPVNQNTNPSTQVELDSTRRPPSVASSEASTTIAQQSEGDPVTSDREYSQKDYWSR